MTSNLWRHQFCRSRHSGWLWASLLVLLNWPGLHTTAQAPKPSIENDPAYKLFKGVDGSKYFGPDAKFSSDLTNTVLNYPGIKYDLPPINGKERCCVKIDGASLIDGTEFEQLMIAAVEPDAQTKNQFVAMTTSLLPQLQNKILASNGGLTPSDIMRISLDISGGNYPLATLVAHNYLKNIAYKGRQAYTKFKPMIEQGKNPAMFRFPPDIGAVASKLVNMRGAPGDKMGIWYHSFVPLAIASWTCHEPSADQSISEEYIVRRLGSLTNMGSPMDPEKKQSDENFSGASHQIFEKRLAKPRFNVCDATVTPEKGTLETQFTLKLKYQIANLTFAATPIVQEDLQVTAKDFKKEVLNKRREVEMKQSREVEIEIPFSPEVEGKHFFEYKLQGPMGFVEKNGRVPFEVGAATPKGWSRPNAPEVEFSPGIEKGATYKLDAKNNTCSITSPRGAGKWKTMGTLVLKYQPPPAAPTVGQIFEVGGILSGYEGNEITGILSVDPEPLYCFQDPDILHPQLNYTVSTLNNKDELKIRLLFGQKLPTPNAKATPPKAPNPDLMINFTDQNNSYVKLHWRYNFKD